MSAKFSRGGANPFSAIRLISLLVRTVIESEVRPTGVQLKRKAKMPMNWKTAMLLKKNSNFFLFPDRSVFQLFYQFILNSAQSFQCKQLNPYHIIPCLLICIYSITNTKQSKCKIFTLHFNAKLSNICVNLLTCIHFKTKTNIVKPILSFHCKYSKNIHF